MIVAQGNIKDEHNWNFSIKGSKGYAGRMKGAGEAQIRASIPISGKLKPRGKVGAECGTRRAGEAEGSDL